MGKCVVTGGAGFIGSHVVEQLVEQNHQVVVIDNLSTGRLDNLASFAEQVQFIQADLAQVGDWQNAFSGAEYVFHLAALADIVPSINNPEAYYQANVTGTFNVLQAAKMHHVKKMVYAASSSCYGIPDAYPTKETAEIRPQYPYALTKRLGEELVMHWGQVYQLPVVSLRLFNVYGTRSRTSGTYGAVFGVFLAQKLANQAFTVVGDGKQTRDFTYVTDVANAFILAACSKVTQKIMNVGSGATVSINRIVELLEGDIQHIPKRPGEPDCTYADTNEIVTHLNWTPSIQIEEGIALLLKNIDYWKHAPVWDKQSIEEATKDWFKYLK